MTLLLASQKIANVKVSSLRLSCALRGNMGFPNASNEKIYVQSKNFNIHVAAGRKEDPFLIEKRYRKVNAPLDLGRTIYQSELRIGFPSTDEMIAISCNQVRQFTG